MSLVQLPNASEGKPTQAETLEQETGLTPTLVYETPSFIHLHADSWAQSRYEIQNEVLRVFPAIHRSFPDKEEYILTLNRPYNSAGSRGEIESLAFRREILTVRCNVDVLVRFMADSNRQSFWNTLVIHRWVYHSLAEKSLRFIDFPISNQ